MLCTLGLTPVPGVAVSNDGDINIDGEVNAADVLWAIQAALGSRTLTTEQQQHGDVAPLVDGTPQPNGVFDLGDVVVITRLVLGGLVFSVPAPPANQFNIGDSIGEGEAANGTIGQAHHETVWSTGYDGGDVVNAFNERYEVIAPDGYYENNAGRDPTFNQAVSGAVMADFSSQAQDVVSAVSQTPSGAAGMVTMLLGNNDVCADSLSAMTDPGLFETQYRAGLDVLASSEATRLAQIHVSGIPAIYWLWNAKRGDFVCRVFKWPFVPCQNLLDNPNDDCASSASRNDPDNDYPGDGPTAGGGNSFTGSSGTPITRYCVMCWRNTGSPARCRTPAMSISMTSSSVRNTSIMVTAFTPARRAMPCWPIPSGAGPRWAAVTRNARTDCDRVNRVVI